MCIKFPLESNQILTSLPDDCNFEVVKRIIQNANPESSQKRKIQLYLAQGLLEKSPIKQQHKITYKIPLSNAKFSWHLSATGGQTAG